jgi:tRNA (guanine37-N1)-methyltransferase
MKISILTLFPDMIKSFFNESIVKRAQEKGHVEIELINLRDFAMDKYGTVDDKPYGGGAGMVLKVEPIFAALQKIKNEKEILNQVQDDKILQTKTILTSAKGSVYSQQKALEFSELDHLVILCGHYEGFDERVMDYVDEEVSLGDFVLTGGELPAAVITDSVVRLLQGVLKKEEATQIESFFEVEVSKLITICGEDEVLYRLQEEGIEKVQLLEFPQYTRPQEFMGKTVPEVIMKGNHAEIEKWQLKKAYEETVRKRPDLLDKKA